MSFDEINIVINADENSVDGAKHIGNFTLIGEDDIKHGYSEDITDINEVELGSMVAVSWGKHNEEENVDPYDIDEPLNDEDNGLMTNSVFGNQLTFKSQNDISNDDIFISLIQVTDNECSSIYNSCDFDGDSSRDNQAKNDDDDVGDASIGDQSGDLSEAGEALSNNGPVLLKDCMEDGEPIISANENRDDCQPNSSETNIGDLWNVEEKDDVILAGKTADNGAGEGNKSEETANGTASLEEGCEERDCKCEGKGDVTVRETTGDENASHGNEAGEKVNDAENDIDISLIEEHENIGVAIDIVHRNEEVRVEYAKDNETVLSDDGDNNGYSCNIEGGTDRSLAENAANNCSGNGNDSVVKDEDEEVEHRNPENARGNDVENSSNDEKAKDEAVERCQNTVSQGGEASSLPAVITTSTASPMTFVASSRCVYLTPVLQLLYSCDEFRDRVIQYHNSDEIANFDYDSESPEMLSKRLFVNELGKLYWQVDARKMLGRRLCQFDNYVQRMANVHACYRMVLKTLESVMDSGNDSKEEKKKAFSSSIKSLFFSIVNVKIWCNKCHKVHEDKVKRIHSMLLTYEKDKAVTNVQKCIDNYFSTFSAKDHLKDASCCDHPRIVGQYKLTRPATYFLIYFKTPSNNQTWTPPIELSHNFLVPVTGSRSLSYGLKGVIRQVRSLFNVECLYNCWWKVDYLSAVVMPQVDLTKDSAVAVLIKMAA